MYPIKMMTPMDANSYSAFQSASWPACHGSGSHGLRDFLHIPPFYGHINHNFPLHLMNHQSSGTSELHCTKDKFSIKLDVHQFSPEEITVKAVDKYVVVDAKHEEKEDEHGYITRSFCRKYPLPKDINPDDFDDKVLCELSSDGILMISVPMKQELEDKNAKILRIKETGQPHFHTSGKFVNGK